MTASGADAFGSDKHSRADDHALIDRIAQRDIDKFPAADEAASKIAHGSEARLDSGTCMRRGNDRLLRDVHIEFLQSSLAVITRKIGSQMRVRIYETRRKRRVAEVDNLRAVWGRQIASRIDNFVALYDDDGVLHERVRFAVEHPCGFKHDWLVGCVRRHAEPQKR